MVLGYTNPTAVDVKMLIDICPTLLWTCNAANKVPLHYLIRSMPQTRLIERQVLTAMKKMPLSSLSLPEMATVRFRTIGSLTQKEAARLRALNMESRVFALWVAWRAYGGRYLVALQLAATYF